MAWRLLSLALLGATTTITTAQDLRLPSLVGYKHSTIRLIDNLHTQEIWIRGTWALRRRGHNATTPPQAPPGIHGHHKQGPGCIKGRPQVPATGHAGHRYFTHALEGCANAPQRHAEKLVCNGWEGFVFIFPLFFSYKSFFYFSGGGYVNHDMFWKIMCPSGGPKSYKKVSFSGPCLIAIA